MDSSGNFYLGGTGGALRFTQNTGVLTVTTGAEIGGFTIASDAIHSGTKDTDGYTTNSITISSGGTIHTPAFYTTTSTAFFKGVVEDTASLTDGTTTKPWSSIFKVDSTGLYLDQPRWKETALSVVRPIGDRFTTIDSTLTTYDSNFDDIEDGFQTYTDCVLKGTKIITERGEVNIEDTNEGDIIKVYNFFTQTWEWSPIDEIYKRETKGWSHIKTKLGIELKCSNAHWLYHPSYPGHKIETNELGVGGQLYVYHDGELKSDVIESIEVYPDEFVTVYNYELERVHNFVSDGVLSHNVAKLAYAVTLGHKYVKIISQKWSRLMGKVSLLS